MIVDTRPAVTIAMQVPLATFAHIWTMALTGGLTHAHFMCDEPHRRMAELSTMSPGSVGWRD